jgi:protein-tyrosine phosphatase
MIDWHCHILPGLDDGPENMDEALDMARLLADAGFVTVHCTPHCIHGRYDNTPSQVRRATDRLQRELLQAGIRLAVKPGMEYYLDEHFPPRLESLQHLGDSRMLLVEIPSRASVDLVRENLRQILRHGYVPLVAHPERCALLAQSGNGMVRKGLDLLCTKVFHKKEENETSASAVLLGELQEMGCLFQGNLSSFAGWYGRGPQKQAMHNLAGGLYSHFGSDGHGRRFLEQTLPHAFGVLADFSQKCPSERMNRLLSEFSASKQSLQTPS